MGVSTQRPPPSPVARAVSVATTPRQAVRHVWHRKTPDTAEWTAGWGGGLHATPSHAAQGLSCLPRTQRRVSSGQLAWLSYAAAAASCCAQTESRRCLGTSRAEAVSASHHRCAQRSRCAAVQSAAFYRREQRRWTALEVRQSGIRARRLGTLARRLRFGARTGMCGGTVLGVLRGTVCLSCAAVACAEPFTRAAGTHAGRAAQECPDCTARAVCLKPGPRRSGYDLRARPSSTSSRLAGLEQCAALRGLQRAVVSFLNAEEGPPNQQRGLKGSTGPGAATCYCFQRVPSVSGSAALVACCAGSF